MRSPELGAGMQRREFIGTLAGGMVAATLPSRRLGAEKIYVVGYLGNLSAGNYLSAAFANQLKELRYSEEKNLKMEFPIFDDAYSGRGGD